MLDEKTLRHKGMEVIQRGQQTVSHASARRQPAAGVLQSGIVARRRGTRARMGRGTVLRHCTLPHFNEDLEAAGDPEVVRRFKEAIRNANAVLIATPEYNGAVPGVLANAIDWASRPSGRSVLRNKPVAVMGAVLGKSGSANAQAALRGVLSRVGAIVVPDPQVLVPRASRLFDEQVNLRDEETREEIRQLVEAVAHWCRRVQPEEPGQEELSPLPTSPIS
jgi:chromate reductase, NAD(P)H dehydrogenase (quinone)